jgi:chromosome segregation ATPase
MWEGDVALTDTKQRTTEAATLKSLKRDLENEKRASAELRESVGRLQDAVAEMQMEFAKQLGQAHAKSRAAEEALSDQSMRLEALGEGREETIKNLRQTQDKLAVVKSERDRLLQRLTTPGFRLRFFGLKRATIFMLGKRRCVPTTRRDSSSSL